MLITLLLGIAILSWAELSSAEPGLQDMVSTVANKFVGSSQSTPKPAANSDKILEIEDDAADLGEDYIPDTSTWAYGDARSKTCTKTSTLSFNATKYENYELRMIKNSIWARPVDPDPKKNKGSVTGGVLGKDVCTFYGSYYEFETVGGTIIFRMILIYYKAEYSSFAEASRHPGAILKIVVPIYVGCDENLLLIPLTDKLKSMKKPGDSVIIQSYYTYAFGKTFNSLSTYKHRKGSIQMMGQWYHNCTVLELPMMEKDNCMPLNQFNEFKKTHGYLLDLDRRKRDTTQYTNDVWSTPPKTSSGVDVNSVHSTLLTDLSVQIRHFIE